jgi:hypothetical protein
MNLLSAGQKHKFNKRCDDIVKAKAEEVRKHFPFDKQDVQAEDRYRGRELVVCFWRRKVRLRMKLFVYYEEGEYIPAPDAPLALGLRLGDEDEVTHMAFAPTVEAVVVKGYESLRQMQTAVVKGLAIMTEELALAGEESAQ